MNGADIPLMNGGDIPSNERWGHPLLNGGDITIIIVTQNYANQPHRGDAPLRTSGGAIIYLNVLNWYIFKVRNQLS